MMKPQARKRFFLIFAAVCVLLGWLGSKPPEGNYVLIARIFTVYYFAYFLVITPVMGLTETPLPLPESISEPVLSHPAAKAAATQKG